MSLSQAMQLTQPDVSRACGDNSIKHTQRSPRFLPALGQRLRSDPSTDRCGPTLSEVASHLSESVGWPGGQGFLPALHASAVAATGTSVDSGSPDTFTDAGTPSLATCASDEHRPGVRNISHVPGITGWLFPRELLSSGHSSLHLSFSL